MGCVVSNAVMKKNEEAAEEAVSVDSLASPKVVRVTQRGAVGVGGLPVKILMGQTHSFGPINLKNDDEVSLLNALLKEKCDAASHRGKSVKAAPQYYSIAERAKSVLHPKVVKFINYAFTKKGLKEHQIGRRRNQYQKRSEVIKIGKNGELIYPTRQLSNATSVKSAQDEVNNNAAPELTDACSKQLTVTSGRRRVKRSSVSVGLAGEEGPSARSEQVVLSEEDYVPSEPSSDDSSDEDWAVGAKRARTVRAATMVSNSTHPMRTRSRKASATICI